MTDQPINPKVHGGERGGRADVLADAKKHLAETHGLTVEQLDQAIAKFKESENQAGKEVTP